MAIKLGYIVPEFPLFTHVFFWRELNVLREMGVEVNVFSTKMPDCALGGGHDWLTSVKYDTQYLQPFHLDMAYLREFIQTPIRRWLKVIKLIIKADDVDFKGRLYLMAAAVIALRLKQHIRTNGLTHLHSHFSYRAADIVLYASVLAEIPYSISAHGSFCGVGNQKQKWRNASFGICVAKHIEDMVNNAIGKNTLPHIYIAPMGVDCDAFKRTSEYKLFSNGAPFRIFSAGRLSVAKGHHILIESISQLVKKGVIVQLKIAGVEIGSGAYLDELNKLISKKNLQANIEFLGAVSSDIIKKELEECHVFALASYAEAFGVVYAEAMAMEVPTIGTNAGGVPELIDDGENGYLVPPKDSSALTEVILKIIRNPEISKEIGRQGRIKMKTYFSCKRSAVALVDGIQKTMKDNRYT